MKYHLISDSKSIAQDIQHFKEHSTNQFTADGLIVIDIKARLIIEEGMDTIFLEIIEG